MTAKKKISGKFKLPILITSIILFSFFIVFIKGQALKNQKANEFDITKTSVDDANRKALSWKTYENSNISFRYPEDKVVNDTLGGPAEKSTNFEIYGNNHNIIMELLIFSVSDTETQQVFGRELSTRIIAEKSRVNKINEGGNDRVSEVKEILFTDLSGHYYDFSGNFSEPYIGGFVTDSSCLSYRAVYLKNKKKMIEAVYCLEEPYPTIFNSIRLK